MFMRFAKAAYSGLFLFRWPTRCLRKRSVKGQFIYACVSVSYCSAAISRMGPWKAGTLVINSFTFAYKGQENKVHEGNLELYCSFDSHSNPNDHSKIIIGGNCENFNDSGAQRIQDKLRSRRVCISFSSKLHFASTKLGRSSSNSYWNDSLFIERATSF